MRSSENRAQNIEYSFGCVARSAVLLEPNVANILLFNFCEQKFVQHGPITIATDCNALFFHFWRNMTQLYVWTKIRTKQWLVLGASALQCMRAGFLCPKCGNFACLQDQPRSKWASFEKIFFFLPKSASSVSRSVAIFPSVVQAYTPSIIYVRRKDKSNYLSNQTWAKIR